ncbi:MAG: transposase [Phycisphaerae bacterium]
MATIAEAHCLDAKGFVRQYREHLSDFPTWEARTHAAEWLVFPENVGAHLSLDEVAISQGELYTVLTNKARHGRHGALVAIVKGTKTEVVSEALRRIPGAIRETVQTVTRDLDASMAQIATACFPNAQQIEDRFHVQQLVSEALQEIRVALRKEAITADNAQVKAARERGGHYQAPRYENGDTAKALLARSRYLLFKARSTWTASQQERGAILFREYPVLQQAYNRSMTFRGIYEDCETKGQAHEKLQAWYRKLETSIEVLPAFETPMQTVQLHEATILNYFDGRPTNASAESKIKNFRALQRGIREVPFFLYRLAKIYG